jgi:hypothetical protein
MNWSAACSTNGSNAEEPAAVMLPDTVKSAPPALAPLLLGAGLVWLLEAHPVKRMLPAKTTDRTNPSPLLPLNNVNPPPKIFKIPEN